MYKIALISANNYRIPYPVYPLGVSYLATYLRNKLSDCRVDIFDCNMGSFEELADFCREGDYRLVAVSLRNIDDTNIFERNCFVEHYRRVMTTIRNSTKAPIQIGGPAFSIFPQLLFEQLQPDWGMVGEGEESLRQLVEKIGPDFDPASIEGLVWRNKTGEVVVNPRNNYISAPALEVDSAAADYYFGHSGMLNIQTKRGCPFGCIYCTYPIIDGRRVRTLDAAQVVDNIERLYFDKGISYLFFTDSIFNIDRAYNEELCRRLIASRAKVRWGAYFAPSNLSREELALYQKAGLTHIEWGTDSFCDEVLERYNKTFRFEDVRRWSLVASDLGIFYAHFLILGGYGESERTLDQTFDNSRQLGLTVMFPYIGMRIYPGTRLAEIAVAEGVIADQSQLISPVYYVSKDIDISKLHARAQKSGQKWVFPDDEPSPMIDRLRERKRRGPLWEYLRY